MLGAEGDQVVDWRRVISFYVGAKKLTAYGMVEMSRVER